MAKIFFFSIIFVLIVLGVNFYWPALLRHGINPKKGQTVIKSFKSAPQSFPNAAVKGAKDIADNAEKNISRFFLEKTGEQITGVLRTLPKDQQKEIKKEYCGE